MSFITYQPMKMEQSVPKRRHIKFRKENIQQITSQVTPVFQIQLLVTQFTINMFHIGFMQVLIL
jgi:hypothetical protein